MQEFVKQTVSPDSKSLSFRPVTSDDQKFLFDLYKSSRGDDLRRLEWPDDRISGFLKMQYAAHRQMIERDYPNVSEEIIECDGVVAGSVLIVQLAGELRCVDLALLPEYRNRGLGSVIIRHLQSRAESLAAPLCLQVLRFNRAVNLFERLGFTRTGETGSHIQFEWNAHSQAKGADRED